MAIDPNVYALSIQMALDSREAFSTLDQFGQSATDVEQQVSGAAQSALGSITDVAAGLDSSLNAAAASAVTVNSISSDINSTSQAIASSFGEMNDVSEDQLGTLREALKILEEHADLREKGLDDILNEKEGASDILSGIEDISDAIRTKNILHREELGLVEDEVGSVRDLGSAFDDVAKAVGASLSVVRFLGRAFERIANTIAAATEIQEQFVENNYRAYGSMEGLAQQTRQLAADQGILESESVAAYKALADVRTPREEIGKYAKQIVMLNRVTGVSIDTLAEYSRRLRAAGGDAGSAELAFNKIQESMRKFGLSAAAMNNILGDSTVSVADLKAMFGDTGVEKFTELQVQMGGFAESVGYNAEVARAQMNLLATDMVASYKLADAAGMDAINSVEDMQRAMVEAGDAASKEFNRIQNSGMDSAEKQKELQAVSKSMGFASTEAMMLSIEMDKLRDQMGGGNVPFNDIMKQAQKNLEDSFTATQRFNRVLEDLYENVGLIFKNFASLIGIVLVPMLKWMARLAGAIATVIGWITSFYDWLRNLWIIGDIIQLGEEFLGLLGAIIISIVAVGSAFAGLAGAGAALTSMFSAMGSMAASIGGIISSVAQSVGTVIAQLLTSIGQGLGALGKSVQPVMLPLLALGAALMMAGVGAYFFAKGVGELLQFGWGQMAGGILMMVAAVGLLGLVLVGLAYLAMPVIPALLAIGAAVLMIGAAAWLMGAGLKMAAEAFELIHDAIGPHSPAMWVALPMVAAGLLLVSAAALIGAPGLLILGAALFVVALAAWALAPAFASIVEAIGSFDSGTIIDVGRGMVIGSSLMLVASGILLAAAIAFVPASFAMLAGMYALAIAAPLSIAVGGMLTLGGTLLLGGATSMQAAANMLAPAASSLLESSQMILSSASMLMAGVPMITVAAGLMLVAGPALVAGAAMFAVGAFFLSSAANTIYNNGVKVGEGGAALLAGTQAIMRAANLIGQAGGALDDALERLSEAIQKLDTNSINALYNASVTLALAGVWLTAGSTGLLIGAIILVSASNILWGGAEVISASANMLNTAGLLFVAVGQNFISAGTLILAGAVRLAIGVGALLFAVIGAFALSPAIIQMAFALIFGSSLLLSAGVILNSAVLLLTLASVSMISSTRFIIESANRLYYSGGALMAAGPLLASGSASVTWASFLLIEAALMLTKAGIWLVPASMAIYTGMWWLETSLDKFRKSIPTIEKIGNAVSKIAHAFQVMKDAPFNSMKEAAETGILAIPQMEKFAKRLPAVAESMKSATEKLAGPANELAQILNNLGDAILKFDGVGQSLSAEMESVSNTLDKYSFRLEAASQRIQTAVETKAVPAMAAASDAGIDEVIKSEAITQIQVANDTGAEIEETADTVLLATIAKELHDLNSKVEGISGSGESEMASIAELLQQYLPVLADKQQGLESEMNQWGR